MPAYFDEHKKTWYCKFRYNDWTGKSRFTTKRGFKTKREAKAYEYEFKARSENSPEMTVETLCDIYLEQYKARNKETSYLGIKGVISRYIKPTLGTVKLSSLTKLMLSKWQETILSSSLAESTKHTVNRRLNSILLFAERMDIIQKNPMANLKSIGKPAKREAFWTVEQYKLFIAAGKGSQQYPMVRPCFDVLFYSGIRLGECLGLKLSSVDFDKGTLTISEAINCIGKPSTLKNDSSYRTIPMPQFVMDEIKAYVDSLPDVPERLFPVSRRMLKYYIDRWGRKAGVPPITVHGLRHSHVSHLISLGIPITVISRRIGHKTPKMTLSVYSHMYDTDSANVSSILQQTNSVGQTVVKSEK